VQVGDLVKETWGMERSGIIIAEVGQTSGAHRRRLFKVLWDALSPTSPTLIGPLWEAQAEVISESR